MPSITCRISTRQKLLRKDWVIFFGLLRDLFPVLTLRKAGYGALEDCVAQACDEKGLWKDEYFQRKCVELSELLAIRHCVFVMGPPAAGKSETWRTLAKAQTIGGRKQRYKISTQNQLLHKNCMDT